MDLSQTTFLIVYQKDSQDREDNLKAILQWLGKIPPILVYEIDQGQLMHRTEAFNDMAREVKTPVLVLMDTDCIIDPKENLQHAQDMILSGEADMVWPFNSPNHCVPKALHKAFLAGNYDLPGIRVAGSTVPCGGIVFCSQASYWVAGGENQNLIAYSPDDQERRHRWRKLGFKTVNIPGTLYHLDHWIGPNSSPANPHFPANHAEFNKIQSMTKEELKEYIKTWSWMK